MDKVSNDEQRMLMELTNDEAMEYNSIIMKFNREMRDDIRSRGHLRLGQAFYNYGYREGIFKGSFPELFYCEDSIKARWNIVSFLCAYVKGKKC